VALETAGHTIGPVAILEDGIAGRIRAAAAPSEPFILRSVVQVNAIGHIGLRAGAVVASDTYVVLTIAP